MAFDYTFKSLKKVMSVSIAPDSYKIGGISASDYATIKFDSCTTWLGLSTGSNYTLN